MVVCLVEYDKTTDKTTDRVTKGVDDVGGGHIITG